MKYLGFVCVSAALLLSACSSYVARVDSAPAFAKYQRLWVKSNFDDNHGMDGRIMRALQAHGYAVDKGPLTMMPLNTQAIVSYDDHWAWDFTTHLTALRVYVKDAKSEALVASGVFSGPVAMMTSVDEAVDRLITRLLSEKAKTPAKA